MRKGQAALEFILTYGWAILIVIIAVSILSYFGVLDLRSNAPERCEVSPGFYCVEYSLNEPGDGSEVALRIQNAYGEPVIFEKLTITCPEDCAVPDQTGGAGCGRYSPFGYDGGGWVNNITVESNEAAWVACNPGNGYDIEFAEKHATVRFTFDYTIGDDSISHHAEGYITARVEE